MAVYIVVIYADNASVHYSLASPFATFAESLLCLRWVTVGWLPVLRISKTFEDIWREAESLRLKLTNAGADDRSETKQSLRSKGPTKGTNVKNTCYRQDSSVIVFTVCKRQPIQKKLI